MNLWDNSKRSSICVSRVPKGEEKEWFWESNQSISSDMVKDTNMQIHEVEWILTRWTQRTLTKNIIKQPSEHWKQKPLKTRGPSCDTTGDSRLRMTAGFWKKNNPQPWIPYPAKHSSRKEKWRPVYKDWWKKALQTGKDKRESINLRWQLKLKPSDAQNSAT
jgi:hypothetical protein